MMQMSIANEQMRHFWELATGRGARAALTAFGMRLIDEVEAARQLCDDVVGICVLSSYAHVGEGFWEGGLDARNYLRTPVSGANNMWL